MKRLFILAVVTGIALIASGQQPDAAPKPDAYGNFNAKLFGAKGDGIADDTPAIQATIDAACGPGDPAKVGRLARGNVFLPPGEYLVGGPLKVHSVSHLRFLGAGKSTRIHPSGVMDSVLDLNGVAYSTFADFLIQGTDTEKVQDCIYFYWDKATAVRSSCGNEFRNIQIQNTRCVTGFRIGQPGSTAQVDTSSYTNLVVTGNWHPGEATWYQHGFYVGSDAWGNNLVHTFNHICETHWAIGFKVTPTNFCLTGGSIGQNGTDFAVSNLSYFSVTGVRSEASQRLATFNLGTSAPGNYSFNDVIFDTSGLAGDQVVIGGLFNGCLRVNNLAIGCGAANPRITMTSRAGASLLIQGLTSSATLESLLSGCSPKVDVVTSGYVQTNLDSSYRASSPGLNLGGGRSLGPAGLFLGGDRYWTPDGLYPGGGIKWKGSGTLIPGPNESFRFVGWEERPLGSGNRREGWVVPPLKGK